MNMVLLKPVLSWLIYELCRQKSFCLCENKDTDHLCSNCTADQCLCFRYSNSTICPLLQSKISPFSVCPGQFVSDLVINPIDLFFLRRGSCVGVSNGLSIKKMALKQLLLTILVKIFGYAGMLQHTYCTCINLSW